LLSLSLSWLPIFRYGLTLTHPLLLSSAAAWEVRRKEVSTWGPGRHGDTVEETEDRDREREREWDKVIGKEKILMM
jgi:hypothetical protein